MVRLCRAKSTAVSHTGSGRFIGAALLTICSSKTADSAKDVILNNAASLDNTLAEDRYKQNLRKLEIVLSIRRYVEQRRLTSLDPFWKDSR